MATTPTPYYIKHINDPRLNSLLAPKNNLYRPPIPYFAITTFCIAFFLVPLTMTFISNWASSMLDRVFIENKIFIYVFWTLLFCFITLKYMLIFSILMYQRYAKASTRLKCCCYPTCSQYAIIALRKYGCIIGSWKALLHCIKCAPPGINEFP